MRGYYLPSRQHLRNLRNPKKSAQAPPKPYCCRIIFHELRLFHPWQSSHNPHIMRSDLQRKSLSFAPKILSPRSLAPQKSTKLRAPIFLASPLSSGKLHWPQPLGLPLIISPSKKNPVCTAGSHPARDSLRKEMILRGFNVNIILTIPPPSLRPRVDRRPFRSAPFKQSNAPQCLRRVRAQTELWGG